MQKANVHFALPVPLRPLWLSFLSGWFSSILPKGEGLVKGGGNAGRGIAISVSTASTCQSLAPVRTSIYILEHVHIPHAEILAGRVYDGARDEMFWKWSSSSQARTWSLCGGVVQNSALCVLLQRHMTWCNQCSSLSWPEQSVYKITGSVLFELAFFTCELKKPQAIS